MVTQAFRILAAVSLTSAFAFSTPAPAAAQPPRAEPSLQLEAYFIGEFRGQYRVRVEGERVREGDLDLDTTFGGGVRAAVGIGVFALGAMAEFRGYGNSVYQDRDFAFDLSPFVGLRIPIVWSRDTALVLRGTVPFGFTVLAPNQNRFGDERYYGYNTGILGGLGVTFGVVGLFADVGVRYHKVFATTDFGGLGSAQTTLSWAQLSVNAGLSLHF